MNQTHLLSPSITEHLSRVFCVWSLEKENTSFLHKIIDVFFFFSFWSFLNRQGIFSMFGGVGGVCSFSLVFLLVIVNLI